MKVKEGTEMRPAGNVGKPGGPGKEKGKGKIFGSVLKEKKKGGKPGSPAEVGASPDNPAESREAARRPRREAADDPFKREGAPEERRVIEEVKGEAAAARLMALPLQPQPDVGTPTEVEKPAAAAEIRQLDAIVEEIVTAVRNDGSTQIDIQLNSRTLQGLHIQITGELNGSVAIRFQAASPQVEQFLARNLSGLSDALSRRNVDVSEIRIGTRGAAGPRKGDAGGRQRRR